LAKIFNAESPRGRARAKVFVESIENRCASLLDFPMQGRARDDLRRGLRILLHARRVLIVYALDDARIVIVRFFVGGQDYEAAILGSD
jgi:toxin ParE1/3/4